MPRYVNLANLQQFAAVNLSSDPGAIGGPVVIPNCVQIVLTWTQASGKAAHNVTYGRSPGVPSPTVAQAQGIVAALTAGTAWTNYRGHVATTTSLASVTLRSVHSGEESIVSSTGGAVAGTNPSIALPNEMAICVTLRTAKSGPSNRGRVYLPGLGSDQVIAGNVVAPSLVNEAGIWVQGFKVAFSAQGYTWVIGQRARAAYTGATGTLHPARPAASEEVLTAVCRDDHWDSQRRRGLR